MGKSTPGMSTPTPGRKCEGETVGADPANEGGDPAALHSGAVTEYPDGVSPKKKAARRLPAGEPRCEQ